jgi:hypothetical protein
MQLRQILSHDVIFVNAHGLPCEAVGNYDGKDNSQEY